MAKIIVNQDNVVLKDAKDYLNLCPFNAIEFDGKIVSINAACRMCKLCVRKGPDGVFQFVEEQPTIAINKDEWKGMCVFVEHHNGTIHPVTFELIGKARDLASVISHPVYAVLIGEENKGYEQELLAYGVDKVFVYRDERLKHFNVETYTNMMEDFIKQVKPSVILYGGTSVGRSFAPRVAARFRTGLTADCTILGMKKNTDLIQNRPAFGGNIMASIVCPNTRPQMSTVRYKIFKMPEKTVPHGTAIYMDLSQLSFSTNMQLKEVLLKDKAVDISEAEVIVACGRPFKTKEDLKLAQELADLLGAQIAVTRPLIEAGLADSKKQIGLSGRTVAPKLLINLGISGAVQYTAGMTGSEIVFSINEDPDAPIFDFSHYAVVGDLFEILPRLIQDIKKEKGVM